MSSAKAAVLKALGGRACSICDDPVRATDQAEEYLARTMAANWKARICPQCAKWLMESDFVGPVAQALVTAALMDDGC